MSKYRTRTTGWNRILSGVLCLALALGLLPAAGMIQITQADQAEHWAAPYAEQLVEWGVMNPAADLRLDDEATRAEFVAMCNRAFGYKVLGGTPFIDVPSSAWYAQDIDIAYSAGYFMGTSADTASPEDPLTREQAAVLLARNLTLRETVGESLGFTDSRELSEWSRGLIAAAANEGMISGYDDGSYRPFNNITRGEVAAMLVRSIGNPVDTAGSHALGDVYGNVTISSSNATLRDTVILGNLYITGGVDLGNVLLENVTVLGRIVISGGGESNAARSSVILRNVEADELVVDSIINQFVTVSAYGVTDIPSTYVRSDVYLEDSCASGYGLRYIELAGESGTRLQLAGAIKEVVNKTPHSLLQLVKGTAETITVDEYAVGSELLVDINTRVDVLNLDVAAWVHGDGDILQLNIGADGSEVDILPEHVDIRPGITAEVDGKEIGSTAASELSSEPRLMAGYPAAASLQPTQAEGLYSGNKPGTIYWAVSEIADGSVSVENLINNPVFGGNILKNGETGLYQSGSISSDARTEYGRLISGLEPDGSYYISAVLMDERGNLSPLKVVSFNTPDDTQPAFADGYPYMTKTSCEVAQVTAMVNKDCTLYWVLVEAGANAPTVQNFKSGSFGGNYGFGSMSVAKNVLVSVTVNSTRLREKTGYDLYLWLNDFNGAMSSDVIKVLNAETQKPGDPSFTTPDETPPVVTDVTQTNFSLEDAIEFTFEVNETPSTLYWAVVTATDSTFIKSSDDLSSPRTQLKVQNGTGAIVSGSKAADDANTATLVRAADFRNLLKYSEYGTHNFRLYYVARDAAGNCSEVKSIIIHTLDNDPPTVTIEFSDAMYNSAEDIAAGRGPKPQADANITLTFSEQVKGEGGEGAKTFVDLYSEVKRYEDLGLKDGDSLLDNARKALTEELEKHITLYYVKSATEEPTPLKPEGENADDELFGWLNLSEAKVELRSTGMVTLTLTNGKAVQLGSGMTYYFHFDSIYDDAYIPNSLMVEYADGTVSGGKDANKNNIEECDSERFTTVYAQVWLSENEDGISKIEDDGDLDGTTLDIVVDVTPKATKNTTASDCWDMVIKSDLAVEFNVYRRVSTGNDTWTDWELMAEKVTIGGLGQNNNPTLTAASLSSSKTTQTTDEDGSVTDGYIGGTDFAGGAGGGTEYTRAQYDTVVGGLQEGHTYQYGISFTSVRGSNERVAWTSLVQLKLSLVAGRQGNVQNLSDSNSVYNSYEDLVNTRALLDEISSVVVGSSTVTVLEVEKQFRDERVPEFTSTSPTFTAGTSTIDISFALSREGTVYYVVAPADGTITTTVDGKEINYEKDGRDCDIDDETGAYYTDLGKKKDALDAAGIVNYIPLSGMEREAFGINFSAFTAPKATEIYNGSFKGNLVRTGSVTYEGTREPIRIAEGLQADTWYYVYLVLQSDSGNLGSEVQVYRVKTSEVTPPTITITDDGSTAVSMTVYDRNTTNTLYDNPMLYYVLVWQDVLPEWSNQYYIWNGGLTDGSNPLYGPHATREAAENAVKTLGDAANSSDIRTVLDAMLYKYGSTGRSYFDEFASDDLKNQVMQYITITTNNTNRQRFGPLNESTKSTGTEFERYMNLGSKYVVLACARHYYSDAGDGTQYGFAAATGLEMIDEIPPELNSGTGLRTAYITKGYEPKQLEDGSWVWEEDPRWRGQDDLVGYTFDGTFSFTFDKAIYTYVGDVLKQIVGRVEAGKESTQVALSELLNLSPLGAGESGIVSVTASNSNRTFTITFQRLVNGYELSLGGIRNVSGTPSPKTLILKFIPETRIADTDPGSFTGSIWEPSFFVSWE